MTRPSLAEEDAFWHWIFQRKDLTCHEKSMLAGIKSTQPKGWQPRYLSHAQIAELASISRSMVIKLEPSLEVRGFLKIHRPMKDGQVIRGRAFAYQVIQVQRELFSPISARVKLCGNPVKEEWETPTPLISQVHQVREHDPPVHPVHSDPLRSSVNSNTKSASKCADATLQTSQQEKVRRYNAMRRREAEEEQVRRDLRVGEGPQINQLDAATRRQLAEIAARKGMGG